MKIMRIKDKNAYFIRPSDWSESLSEEEQKYKPITEINKDDLIEIIDHILRESIDMDEYNDDLIANPAEKIVYKHIYEGLKQAIGKKEIIVKEIDENFKEAFLKYN